MRRNHTHTRNSFYFIFFYPLDDDDDDDDHSARFFFIHFRVSKNTCTKTCFVILRNGVRHTSEL